MFKKNKNFRHLGLPANAKFAVYVEIPEGGFSNRFSSYNKAHDYAIQNRPSKIVIVCDGLPSEDLDVYLETPWYAREF